MAGHSKEHAHERGATERPPRPAATAHPRQSVGSRRPKRTGAKDPSPSRVAHSTSTVCSTHLVPPWATFHRPAADGGGIPPAGATEWAQPLDPVFRASLSSVKPTYQRPSLATNSHLPGSPTFRYTSRSTCSNRPLMAAVVAAFNAATPLITTCAAAAHAASTCTRRHSPQQAPNDAHTQTGRHSSTHLHALAPLLRSRCWLGHTLFPLHRPAICGRDCRLRRYLREFCLRHHAERRLRRSLVLAPWPQAQHGSPLRWRGSPVLRMTRVNGGTQQRART